MAWASMNRLFDGGNLREWSALLQALRRRMLHWGIRPLYFLLVRKLQPTQCTVQYERVFRRTATDSSSSLSLQMDAYIFFCPLYTTFAVYVVRCGAEIF